MRYKVILADPPWTYKVWSKKGAGRTAAHHYDVMTTRDLEDMRRRLDEWADNDCCLFMWATYPNLQEAFHLMEEWGFKYKTVAFTWIKLNKDGFTPFTGMGYWTRANAEICLLGTRGHPKRNAKNVRQVIMSKRREHSRKPDEQYERIEALVDGPYLEMFARPPHQRGWDVWGDECEDGVE